MIKKLFRRHVSTPDSTSSTASLESVPDNFFFATPVLTQRLDLLRHLIQSSGFFLILVGEQGAGKSTLLKQLVTLADPRWEVCSVPTVALCVEEPVQPGVGLLERLLTEYNLTLSTRDADAMKSALFDHIGALHNSGGIPLIIVDGNEPFSLEDLQLLAELSSVDGDINARIVLICKPESVRRIRELMSASDNEITHTMDVPPFTEEQAGDYIHLRWNQTNLVGDNPFTDGVIRSIYHASKGLPANVNRLAEQFLQNREPNRRPMSHRKVRAGGRGRQTVGNLVLDTLAQRRKSLALIGGLLIIAIPLLIIINHEPGKKTEMVTLPMPIPSLNTQQTNTLNPDIGLGDIALGQTSPSSLEIMSNQGTALQKAATPVEEFKSAIAPWPPTATDSEDIAVSGDITATNLPEPDNGMLSDDTPNVTSGEVPSEAANRALADASKAIGEKRLPTDAPNRHVPDPTVEPVTAEPIVTAPIAAPTISPPPMTASRDLDSHRKGTDEKVLSTSVKDKAKPAPGSVKVKPPSSAPSRQKPKSARIPERLPKQTAVHTAAWLRRQNPDDFTIQLVGLSAKERMTAFIREHRLDSRAAWFKTSNKGKDWFVIVYGVYPTRKAASKGIQALPSALREGKPWPISIDDILKKAQ
ncbi:MAG: AAA family ATPase [Gammaproteobacteria bacterium]|nr:AAA family ATPase [Gammaproteobacteria bacterium]